MAQKQKIAVITPAGVARFPHVHKPDTDGKFADNKHKITLVLAGDADLSKVEAAAKAAMAGERPNVRKVNILIINGDEKTNKDGDPIEELQGKNLITAKSQFAPQVVGPDKKPLPAGMEVRGGDVVKCILQPVVCDMPTKNSVAFRLLAVQLVEKRAGGGGAYASMFDEEGEGFGGAADSTPSKGVDAGDGAEDDDLPF